MTGNILETTKLPRCTLHVAEYRGSARQRHSKQLLQGAQLQETIQMAWPREALPWRCLHGAAPRPRTGRHSDHPGDTAAAGATACFRDGAHSGTQWNTGLGRPGPGSRVRYSGGAEASPRRRPMAGRDWQQEITRLTQSERGLAVWRPGGPARYACLSLGSSIARPPSPALSEPSACRRRLTPPSAKTDARPCTREDGGEAAGRISATQMRWRKRLSIISPRGFILSFRQRGKDRAGKGNPLAFCLFSPSAARSKTKSGRGGVGRNVVTR